MSNGQTVACSVQTEVSNMLGNMAMKLKEEEWGAGLNPILMLLNYTYGLGNHQDKKI